VPIGIHDMTIVGELPRWKKIYADLVEQLVLECRGFYGERLISFCVFGSVGRDSMHYASDIDCLIVAAALPLGRVKRVREFMQVESKLGEALTEARRNGVFIELSPVIKTPEEVRQGSLLFLDMLEDGQVLFDRDAFLKGYFAAFRQRLEQLGARRIRKGDAWYWVLKEEYKPGEEFAI